MLNNLHSRLTSDTPQVGFLVTKWPIAQPTLQYKTIIIMFRKCRRHK